MKSANVLILLQPLLLSVVALSQPSYPADTILVSPETSLLEGALVAPISLWQRLSYHTNFLNCQFYPSCSNYAAQSISQYGIFLGTALAAERIVRCNPAAFHYHTRNHDPAAPLPSRFYSDWRLMDPVPEAPLAAKDNVTKSPNFAALLSAVIPGAGRVYAGRGWDGLFGFSTVALAVNAAYMSYRRENAFAMVFFGLASLIFYSGEIVGAYRAAAMAHERPEQSQLK